MYREHFGMRQLPFQLTPNTSFRFNLPSHHEALNVLMVTLRSGEGFVKIVGEVGTGKSLLCRTLLNTLGDGFVTAYIPDPCLSPLGVRLALAEELGLTRAEEIGEHQIMRHITERLIEFKKAGKNAVLLMDEAQALPRLSFESLRLLTNLETETSKLLQIVLFGQPELDQLLAEPGLRQVRQRITFSHRLQPMNRLDMEGYVAYRLALAGYVGSSLFSPAALSLLYRASRGVPRLVNILCHKALLAAYGQGDVQVQRKHVRAAIADTEGTGRTALEGWRQIVSGVFPRKPRMQRWQPQGESTDVHRNGAQRTV
jgi:MSHA biogenesis protein MshM